MTKEETFKIPIWLVVTLTSWFLSVSGANMENEKTLQDLGVGPNGTVQLEMQSADPVNTPIKAFRPRQEYVMPDVITVRVETGEHISQLPALQFLSKHYQI